MTPIPYVLSVGMWFVLFTTRCPECQDWSVEIMSEYLKHKKSLATKRGEKAAAATASGSSQPAVASSPLLGSPPRLPSISDDDDKIRGAILSVLQNWSQSGNVGTNLFFLSSSLTCTRLCPSLLLGETAALNPTMWEASPNPLVWVLVGTRLLLVRPLLCNLIYLLPCLLVLGQLRLLIVFMLFLIPLS